MARPGGDNGVENAALRRIEHEYENRIGRAFSSGHSVVEISRVIGCKRALPVYRILQRRGLIETSLKRSRFKGPDKLHNALRRMGLSFNQWCNSWQFEPPSAEHELSRSDTSSTSGIRLAAERDFPRIFAKGNQAINLEEWEQHISSSTTGYSYRIDWDTRLEKYLGTIIGVELLTIIGKHPSVVMMELVRGAWLLKAIDLLGSIGKR
ncbi:MAG: hypothetical protein HXX11_16105 [Desulfuromonadales bacterium]|nr:hypothetical protein [Desulfuromonadales bacterium]